MTQDEELIFKRFPADKQDQVRGLVEYATLMGLTGKDLVSIGGKLDRIRANQDRKYRLEAVRAFNPIAIGADRTKTGYSLREALHHRFKLNTANGTYIFENHYGDFKVKSVTTGKTKTYSPTYEDFGRLQWKALAYHRVLWDVHSGQLQLNF